MGIRSHNHVSISPGSRITVEQEVLTPQKQVSSLRGSASWTVPMRMTLRPNVSDWRFQEASRSLMVEVPVPASMELSAASFWAISRHAAVRHAELNTAGLRPVLGLFVDSFEEPLSFDLEFTAQASLNVSIGAVRVLPMYQPEHAVAAVGTRVEITV